MAVGTTLVGYRYKQHTVSFLEDLYANKMIRRYFPKGTNFSMITQAEVDDALWTINNKPRASLGFKSAAQCAYKKGLLLSEVS